jgi:hypothetical protein
MALNHAIQLHGDERAATRARRAVESRLMPAGWSSA